MTLGSVYILATFIIHLMLIHISSHGIAVTFYVVTTLMIYCNNKIVYNYQTIFSGSDYIINVESYCLRLLQYCSHMYFSGAHPL